MNLPRLREIAKKSKTLHEQGGSKLQFANCMRSLKAYAPLFCVDRDTFAQTAEEYFKYHYKAISACYVDEIDEVVGHPEKKVITGYLKCKTSNGNYIDLQLFQMETEDENENYSINLLKLGLVESVFEVQNDSEVVGFVAEDVDAIAWATMSRCLARDAKIRMEEKLARLNQRQANIEQEL